MNRIFDSISDCVDEIQATVKGNLPSWLSGNLYRIGPGKFDLSPQFRLNHWFDGCAMIYKLKIKDQKVTFKSRFLDSLAYQKMCKVQRPVFTEFGTKSFPDPCKNVFSRYFSQIVPLEMTDNTVANIYPLKDEIYCSSETCNIWRIDPESLKAIEKTDISKLVSVNMASSHPLLGSDGAVYNLGASFMSGPKYNIIKFPLNDSGKESKSLKNASIVATIPSSWSTCLGYYHSFGMTDNYFILIEQPLLINTMKLAASGVKGYSLKECLEWTPKEKTRFIVVDRRTGHQLKAKYIAEAMFLFHHINAHEDENHLVVDVIAFENAEIIDKFYLEKLRANIFDTNAQPQPRRYVIPLSTDARKGENLIDLTGCEATAVNQGNGVVFLKWEILCTPGFEMPSLNKKYNGKKYRYFYGSGVFEKSTFRNAVCKIDIESKEHKLWKGTDSMYPGEVTFVACPDAIFEDDGILLTTVIDVDPTQPDFLLVLNAKSFTEIARAEIQPDVRIPFAAHGFFKG